MGSHQISFLFLAYIFVFQIATAQKKEVPEGAVIEWEKQSHDFGEIIEGEKVEFTYKFTNKGSEPLIIINVQVTCGCTTPKGWPRDPIKSGRKAEIPILFNSVGKLGRQNKVITVVSNAMEGNSQITFSAVVLEKKPN